MLFSNCSPPPPSQREKKKSFMNLDRGLQKPSSKICLGRLGRKSDALKKSLNEFS